MQFGVEMLFHALIFLLYITYIIANSYDLRGTRVISMAALSLLAAVHRRHATITCAQPSITLLQRNLLRPEALRTPSTARPPRIAMHIHFLRTMPVLASSMGSTVTFPAVPVRPLSIRALIRPLSASAFSRLERQPYMTSGHHAKILMSYRTSRFPDLSISAPYQRRQKPHAAIAVLHQQTYAVQAE